MNSICDIATMYLKTISLLPWLLISTSTTKYCLISVLCHVPISDCFSLSFSISVITPSIIRRTKEKKEKNDTLKRYKGKDRKQLSGWIFFACSRSKGRCCFNPFPLTLISRRPSFTRAIFASDFQRYQPSPPQPPTPFF